MKVIQKWNILSEYKKGDIVEVLLKSRGVENADEFLNPLTITKHFEKLPASLRKSLIKAKELVVKAMKEKTPIIIYGDYDADGICATAILYETLKNELRHKNTYYFIPNRFEHGYGMSEEAINHVLDEILPKDCKKALWITVDTGITAVEEIAFIKDLGHEVILTDHHQKSGELPKADCLVWHDKIVGATLAWLLAKVLGSKNKQSISLAGLATVTDLQPLLEFNRSIVKAGLNTLNKNPPEGIKQLLQVAGRYSGKITTYELGWVIGPRLNASGRLGSADDSVNLLLSKNPDEALDLAVKLNSINATRQDKTFEMYGLASELEEDDLPHIIFSSHKDYHEGIIGLVARLSQKYYRPSIVISLNGEFGKGSVRSVFGINIIEMLRKFDHLFENLGGHPMAAGFTIRVDNLDELQKSLLDEAQSTISDDLLMPFLDIDMKIPVSLVDLELLEKIERLRPFGVENRAPVFMSEGVGVAGVDFVGAKKQHVLIKLFDGKNFYKAIFFSGVDTVNALEISIGDKVDLAYTIKRNDYNGRTYVDLVVKDLRKN